MTDTIIDEDIRERLRLMRELLDKAESTLGEDFGSAIADPVAQRGNAAAIRADYLAKLQRVSGWALRDAVTDGLQHGMTWRWMGTASQLPVGTLHRQYNAGGRIVVHGNVTQEPDYSAPQSLSERGRAEPMGLADSMYRAAGSDRRGGRQQQAER